MSLNSIRCCGSSANLTPATSAHRVLILNPDGSMIKKYPLQSTDWETAIRMIAKNRAEVADAYLDAIVRSKFGEYYPPAVIRLLRPHQLVANVSFSSKNLWLRDLGICQYCQQEVAFHDKTFDHVHAKSCGGTACWENAVLACLPCNQHKQNMSLDALGIALPKQPHVPTSEELYEKARATSLLAAQNYPAPFHPFLEMA